MKNNNKGAGKKKKKQEKEVKTRLILETDEDYDYSGMFIGKEDARLFYNALKEYKPMPEEENLHMVWLEMFEEMLVVDYGEPYPDAN